MKILIVYREDSLYRALEQQLGQRGHAVLGATVEQLAGLLAEAGADDEEQWVVIDTASRELDAIGQSALGEITFDYLLGRCARRRGTLLLLLSDSRVFPTGGKQRYREVDPPQPNTAPGTALAERERRLAAGLPRHLILRTGPLIDAHGDNLLTGQLERLRGTGVLAAANGARFCPTPVPDLARVVAAICDQLSCNAQCWGIYHYHSSDPATGYEFAEVLLAAATQYWPLDAGATAASATDGVSPGSTGPAARIELQVAVDDPLASLYPLLSCQRIRDTFGIQQLPWRKAIPQLLKTIYAGENP